MCVHLKVLPKLFHGRRSMLKSSSWDSSAETTDGGSPTSYGHDSSHGCPRDLGIRSVAIIRECATATRWMRSSSCCAPVASGTRWMRRESARVRQRTGDSWSGRKRVFWEFWQRGLLAYDKLKGIDWSWLSMDGAMTKAPLGGEKNRTESNRPSQAWYQAQRADRSERHSDQRGRRGRQPQRLQDGARHHRAHSDRTA